MIRVEALADRHPTQIQKTQLWASCPNEKSHRGSPVEFSDFHKKTMILIKSLFRISYHKKTPQTLVSTLFPHQHASGDPGGPMKRPLPPTCLVMIQNSGRTLASPRNAVGVTLALTHTPSAPPSGIEKLVSDSSPLAPTPNLLLLLLSMPPNLSPH